jgi:hypothetical protein
VNAAALPPGGAPSSVNWPSGRYVRVSRCTARERHLGSNRGGLSIAIAYGIRSTKQETGKKECLLLDGKLGGEGAAKETLLGIFGGGECGLGRGTGGGCLWGSETWIVAHPRGLVITSSCRQGQEPSVASSSEQGAREVSHF